MIKQRLTIIIVAILSILCIALTACGNTEPPLTATAPQMITDPDTTPEPSHSPRIDVKETLTVDGSEVDCYADPSNEDIRYALLSDVVKALGTTSDIDRETKRYTFLWRDQECSVAKDDTNLIIGDQYYVMDAPPFTYKGSEFLYVPVESFCRGLDIGILYDSVNYRLYCTPASGPWELPSGRTVPVIMHYAVGYEEKADKLYTELEQVEKEFQYLSGNGYTFCWFEDLWDLDNIEKPVIMTFDDGWLTHSTYLKSLVTKYNAKVTEFLVASNINSAVALADKQAYMTTKELMDLYDTGLVSIQSHSMNDPNDFLDRKEYQIKSEIVDTKLFITRLCGKEPIAFAYPYGQYNDYARSLVEENFRFGLTSCNSDAVWTTGVTDNTIIPRFYPERGIAHAEFVYYMENGGIPKDRDHTSFF